MAKHILKCSTMKPKEQLVGAGVDETTSLLQRPTGFGASTNNHKTVDTQTAGEVVENGRETPNAGQKAFPKDVILAVFPILLLGVFLANADSSIVLATNQHIASEFNASSLAAWLLTTYTLSQCSCQPLYGKISDIYGRKKNLAFSWSSFAVGCLIIGTGKQFSQVLIGRAVSGIGAAGMTALTSIVIADLLPLNYIAQYRSYINFTATMARSIGGPVGGWLADSIGWRWCFIIQCPLAFCGLALVLWKLPEHVNPVSSPIKDGHISESRLGRVDFFGACTLVGTVLTCLLSLDQGTKGLAWYYLAPLLVSFVAFSAAFIAVEKWYAKEPILPLDLISKRDVFTPYLIVGLQAAGQFGLLYGIPIYFQVAAGETVSRAGARIVPVVIGNATGTILGGRLITTTQRYKTLTVVGVCCSLTCFTLMCLRWRGSSNWIEACYVSLAGFGMGTTQSTTFVHLAASLDHSEIAIAGTTWFLAQSFGSLVGASFDVSLINGVLRSNLESGLREFDDRSKIIEHVTSNIESIRNLPYNIRQIVKGAYVKSLTFSDGLSILFVTSALLTALTLKERKL